MEITSALQSEQHVKKELAKKMGELQERLGELKETVRPATCGASHRAWRGECRAHHRSSAAFEQAIQSCKAACDCCIRDR